MDGMVNTSGGFPRQEEIYGADSGIIKGMAFALGQHITEGGTAYPTMQLTE